VNDAEIAERLARVESALAGIEDDPPALAALQAVVELYGEALRRLVRSGAIGAAPDDDLVAHLLLVHDLHPEGVETRVARALEEVRPYLGSHGGGVELVGISGGVARVRLEGTCDGCASSTATLKDAIERAVLQAAPELEAVEAEGVEAAAAGGLLQIRTLECPTELQTA